MTFATAFYVASDAFSFTSADAVLLRPLTILTAPLGIHLSVDFVLLTVTVGDHPYALVLHMAVKENLVLPDKSVLIDDGL